MGVFLYLENFSALSDIEFFQHTWPRGAGMLESSDVISVRFQAFSLVEKGLHFAEDKLKRFLSSSQGYKLGKGPSIIVMAM